MTISIRWLAILLALVVWTPAQADPLIRVRNGQAFLPPAPGTPVSRYDLSYPADRPWKGDKAVAGDLAARVFPEPLKILRMDGAARTVRIETTRTGRASLDNAGAEIRALDAAKPEPDCVWVVAPLTLGKGRPDPAGEIVTRGGAVCPFAARVYPHRELIVEGLDARGRRLFATVTDDPRWRIIESLDPDGRLKLEAMGRREEAAFSVKFRMPITDRLVRLRVWRLDDKSKASALGDIPWTGVTVTP